MEIREVDSLTLNDVPSIYRTMRERVEGREIIIDGLITLREALKRGMRPLSLLVHHEVWEKLKSEFTYPENCQIYLANKNVMAEITGFKIHQGVMGQFPRPESHEVESLQFPILVLNRVGSAENVGGLMRSASSLGFKSVLLDGESAHPYLRRSIRVSMGRVFDLQVCRSQNILEDLENIQTRGGEVRIAENKEESPLLSECHLPKNLALVMGNEGEGVSESLLKTFPDIVTIETLGERSSLNVSISGSIIMYKWFTQWGRG